MIILAIADRPPRTSIKKLLEENNIELIITLGDLRYFDIQELKGINSVPKIGVYGNHCSGKYFDKLGIENMHLKTFTYQNAVFGGFEGSLRYKQSPYAKMYTQEEAKTLLKDFPRVDVMLAHAPPYGINDDHSTTAHIGLKALREYIEKKKPKYFLHGHTYPSENELVQKYGDTKIIYVYQDKIINLSL